MRLSLPLEVFVGEDVRCSANQPETHTISARIARRKKISLDHNHLVRRSMTSVMERFVNAALSHSVSSPKR